MQRSIREIIACPQLRLKQGQAMIESCIAIGLICVIFFGAMQVSQLAASREIMHHAAARGARAKTVGFNWWMVRKAIHVAAIPNSGRMITPGFVNIDDALRDAITYSQQADQPLVELWVQVLSGQLIPASKQYWLEKKKIREYMETDNNARGEYVLNYVAWDTGSLHYDVDFGNFEELVSVNVWQDYTNWLSLPRTFYAGDSVMLSATHTLDNHYTLYIDDQNW